MTSTSAGVGEYKQLDNNDDGQEELKNNNNNNNNKQINNSQYDNDNDNDNDHSSSSSSEEEDEDTLSDLSLLPSSSNKNKRRSRSSSIQFDFTPTFLLPPSDSFDSTSISPQHLSSSSTRTRGNGNGNRSGSGKLPAEPISLLNGVALIMGLQIGSGIFSSPGIVARETGSVGTALIVWLVAGGLSWAGGSSFAELGSSLPLRGGQQAYLEASFGPLSAYCFSFTAIIALKPGSQAIISLIGAEYLCRLIYHTAFSIDPHAAVREVSGWIVKGVAVGMLVLVGGIQAWSSRAGRGAQLGLTVFKVLALCAVFIGGLIYLSTSLSKNQFDFNGSSDNPTGYALALFSALWTYDGWDQANYVAKDCAPGTLPIMINTSLAMVVILFLCANISYFLVLPFSVATATSTIGLDFGRALAGPVGGVLFAVIVSLSCLGALNGSLYTSSRLIVAASSQSFLPPLLANYHPTLKTPINGILLSSALSTLFICFGDFARLTLFYGVTAWTWNLVVVIGLLVLRVREPGLKRPYKTYLATPILFASTALFLIILSCFSKPWESLAAFIFCIAGTIPYYFQVKRNERERINNAREMEMN